MDYWLHTYEKDLRLVFQDCSRIISGFPEPLDMAGHSYLDHFNVFCTGSRNNYICYLLPFWMQEGCSLTIENTRQMSVGNVFLMLYFFIQDDLMDSLGPNSSDKLPLANLLYIEFLNIYRALFPYPSTFWTYFNRYIAEWADSVTNERTSDYFLNDPMKIARKASPLKLSSTAALLLSGQSSLVTPAETMLDHVLLTLQMLDDYEDWEEDLSIGNANNCLLSLVRSRLAITHEELTAEKVKDFIYTADGLAEYAARAQDNHNRLPDCRLMAPRLTAFHSGMIRNLQQIAAEITREKLLLQHGGLYYWLSKNMTQDPKQ
ncbi:hypothetical protein GCM10010912_30940 [Paenibacillus albidus]|uniref:Uncharacterized protein n=1 Tax=Paenibacillus albidus TaxID=2041023 RepID=A0A917FGN5_9BACL|nr:class 1 isoprenoid biosynthesis enzyme [Paenibacillus albidus]GGF83579.1 hypothetical protein GCM10010912_30940 [Paenibacillus albidus]